MTDIVGPPLVALEGSPTQIGLDHGRILRGEIRALLQSLDRFVFRRVGPVQGFGLRVVARSFAMAMERQVAGSLKEEMRGIALGSGVPYAEILLLNCLDDILNILRRLAPRAPHLACSSFAIFGAHTEDGRLIHGRNLDYHFRNTPLDDGGAVSRMMQKEAVLMAVKPNGRAAFLALGWPGLAGVLTAMNQEGISLGNLTSYVRGTTPRGMPTSLLYREVMEGADTLREAGRILRAHRRTIGNNLMVGSGRDNSAALFELTQDAVMEVAPHGGLLVATNHFASPVLAGRQRPYLIPHSVARWRRLRALAGQEGLSVEDAQGILADTGCSDGQETSPFNRIANEGTAASVLFRPAELEMWVGVSQGPPASGGAFLRIDGASLMHMPAGEPA